MKDQKTTSQWEETLKKQINEPATFEKLWNEAVKRECVVYEAEDDEGVNIK